MNTTTLQVPIEKSLKSSAKIAAREYGFSSLQDLVRLFLTKLANRQIVVNFEESPVQLSQQAIRKYEKMAGDFEKGRNVKSIKSVSGLMQDLRS